MPGSGLFLDSLCFYSKELVALASGTVFKQTLDGKEGTFLYPWSTCRLAGLDEK